MIRRGWFAKFSLWFVISLLAGFFIFFIGLKVNRNISSPEVGNNLSQIQEKPGVSNFNVFWEAWDTLKKSCYYRDSLNDKKMVYGAIEGLMRSTGDPYTEFYPPGDAKKFKEDVNGQFGGIGAEIGTRDGILQIISPLKSAPAERTGLKAGDEIVKIDGTITSNMSVFEAVKRIRGPIGKKVVLTIFRKGWKKTKDFGIIRELINIPSSKLSFLESGKYKIAYLQIYSFSRNLQKDFHDNAFKIISAQPDGLILDLRNNPGGYLNVAVYIAGWFLKRGEVVVKEKFLDQPATDLKAEGNSYFRKLPTVILINGGSASASEILSAALREERGIPLVGEKSYGKGSVQTVKCLSDNSCLKITVALWLTPKGEEIEKVGIKPDIKVEENGEAKFGGKNDNQLQKAEETLVEEIKNEGGKNKFLEYIKSLMPKVNKVEVEFKPAE